MQTIKLKRGLNIPFDDVCIQYLSWARRLPRSLYPLYSPRHPRYSPSRAVGAHISSRMAIPRLSPPRALARTSHIRIAPRASSAHYAPHTRLHNISGLSFNAVFSIVHVCLLQSLSFNAEFVTLTSVSIVSLFNKVFGLPHVYVLACINFACISISTSPCFLYKSGCLLV